jgi:TPR repeat protein
VPPPPADPRLTATLLRRGTSLLAIGDISGARRFLERAANERSAEAARLLAETYDPNTPPGLQTRGLQPDRAAALRWYRRAAALGASVDRPIAALEAAP